MYDIITFFCPQWMRPLAVSWYSDLRPLRVWNRAHLRRFSVKPFGFWFLVRSVIRQRYLLVWINHHPRFAPIFSHTVGFFLMNHSCLSPHLRALVYAHLWSRRMTRSKPVSLWWCGVSHFWTDFCLLHLVVYSAIRAIHDKELESESSEANGAICQMTPYWEAGLGGKSQACFISCHSR